jgi:hypothetical protein
VCQNENNCRDQACLEENCLDQFEECFGIENEGAGDGDNM